MASMTAGQWKHTHGSKRREIHKEGLSRMSFLLAWPACRRPSQRSVSWTVKRDCWNIVASGSKNCPRPALRTAWV